MIDRQQRPRPAWTLTDVDVERFLAVFARTLARALAEELASRGASVTIRTGDER